MAGPRQRTPELFNRVVLIPPRLRPDVPVADADGASAPGEVQRIIQDRRTTLPYGKAPPVTLDRFPRSRAARRWRPAS